uniref:Alkylated DNA repair protein AlkB homologue 8 N-terminal domain-containing protein n=1 Tax=Astyanax mexicanus TaxID=7994 RepID=A0A8B9RC03_ASTMX
MIYLPLNPSKNCSLGLMFDCMRDVECWMSKNFLKLNQDKTDIIIFGNPDSVSVKANDLGPLNTNVHDHVKNLGFIFDFHDLTDCVASHKDNIILKFADDTAVIGRITGGDEAAYRSEVTRLVLWCEDNNLALNTVKTKELIVDMRKGRRPHQPLFIRELEVERVSSFKYLGVHISQDLTWTINTTQLVKKAQQRLYFLRRLRKFGMSPKILNNFYSCVIESLLTSCITVWYGSTTVAERKRLQRVVKTAEKIIRTPLPSLQSIYHHRVHRRAASILKDSTHPQHGLFTLLPSGRRYRSVKCKTTRLKNSFFPTAIRLLNTPKE